MNEDTRQKLMEIKRSFRPLMNGPVSQSMRDKGVDYKLNWGVTLPHLREMAQEYGQDRDLAIALWKEDIRECKILATLIMPPAEMSRELVDVWMEGLHGQEMAEMLAFHLLQYLDFALDLAFGWMASDKPLYQLTAYHLMSRLLSRGQELDERETNEFLDQAAAALQEGDMGLRHAVANCVSRFASLSDIHEAIARAATRGLMEL